MALVCKFDKSESQQAALFDNENLRFIFCIPHKGAIIFNGGYRGGKIFGIN